MAAAAAGGIGFGLGIGWRSSLVEQEEEDCARREVVADPGSEQEARENQAIVACKSTGLPGLPWIGSTTVFPSIRVSSPNSASTSTNSTSTMSVSNRFICIVLRPSVHKKIG
jgi:hypothetical protein